MEASKIIHCTQFQPSDAFSEISKPQQTQLLVRSALLAEESVVGQSLLLTSKTSKVIQAVVRHPGFDLFFAVIVFLNAIFMGIEVQSSIDGDWLPPQLPQVVNYVPWCPMLPAATKNFALRFLRKLLQKNVATWFWAMSPTNDFGHSAVRQPCRLQHFCTIPRSLQHCSHWN